MRNKFLKKVFELTALGIRERRVSLLLFIWTAVIVLLQWFPLTGVFLMMLAAPFWTIVTVNLGFIALAIEAVAGLADRRWILAPLIWFGGYTYYAHSINQQYLALDAEIRAQNKLAAIVFDPQKQVLVIDAKSEDLSGAAIHFVRAFGLPVAYEANPNFSPAQHVAYRLAGKPLCDRMRDDRSLVPVGIYPHWYHEKTGTMERFVPGMCLMQMPEDPKRPVISVKAVDEKQESGALPRSLVRITISDGQGHTAALVSGQAEILGWIPKPVMGCALNSGAPSWDCFYGFLRQAVGLGGEGAYGGATLEIIAGKLGLSMVPVGGRSAEVEANSAAIESALRAAAEQRATFALANLDAAIADPKKRLIIHDVPGLAAKPERTLSRGAAIVAAIVRNLEVGQATHETVRVMESLLANFPAADFEKFGPALSAALLPHVQKREWVMSDDFAIRWGDFGGDALPLLEPLLFAGRDRPSSPPIFGLCRAGPAAAGLAERLVALASTGDKRSDDGVNTAVYVTLRRWGRDDLIDRERAANGRFARVRDSVIARVITPQSPRQDCYGEVRWPVFPE